MPPPIPTSLPLAGFYPWAGAAAAGLAVWDIYEIHRLWRTRPAGARLSHLILAPHYRLSTSAALMGLSNGVLYPLYGSWSYSSMLQQGVERLVAISASPWPIQWVLFAAMFAGMVMSTWQRRSFYLDWRPSLNWLRNLGGGLLMSSGTALVPGGNDTLVFYGIPSLSPHALPVYLAMLAGIGVALFGLRWLALDDLRVDCTGDVCVGG